MKYLHVSKMKIKPERQTISNHTWYMMFELMGRASEATSMVIFDWWLLTSCHRFVLLWKSPGIIQWWASRGLSHPTEETSGFTAGWQNKAQREACVFPPSLSGGEDKHIRTQMLHRDIQIYSELQFLTTNKQVTQTRGQWRISVESSSCWNEHISKVQFPGELMEEVISSTTKYTIKRI